MQHTAHRIRIWLIFSINEFMIHDEVTKMNRTNFTKLRLNGIDFSTLRKKLVIISFINIQI